MFDIIIIMDGLEKLFNFATWLTIKPVSFLEKDQNDKRNIQLWKAIRDSKKLLEIGLIGIS